MPDMTKPKREKKATPDNICPTCMRSDALCGNSTITTCAGYIKKPAPQTEKATPNNDDEPETRYGERMKYKTILSDPPWKFKYYGKSDDRYRRAEGHYDVMDLPAIKNLPVKDIADDDCVLFMWAINPMLPQAFEVIESWGFTFKTVAFVWIKVNNGLGLFTGMGYWTRANSELCLLATKGHPKRIDCNVHQVIMAPKREHSRKPDEIYGRIERLVGGPYAELFARRKRLGWSSWGNEIESDIQMTG
jgi:N6-adenosine-specific RNA methylase IME4